MSLSFASSSSLRGASGRPPSRQNVNGLSRSSSTGASGDTTSSASTLRRATDLAYANLDNDEDFERLLASYDVPLAMDVLRRYLAMEVQSSLTGAASSKQNSAQIKRQFYERFNQILDRVFGNDEVSKHKYGGWLDYSVGLATTSTTGSLGAQRKKKLLSSTLGSLSPAQEEELRMESYLDSLTPSGRTLTDFLGFIKEDEAGSMFQLLFKMTHPVEFKFDLDLLPEQSKLSLLSRSAYTSVLFTQLLQKPITKQRVDPRNPVLLLSIKELFLFYFMRHPACANHQTSPATSEAAASTTPRSSSIMGSISDTFARPKRKENYSWRAFFTEGIGSLTKGNPYNVLLLQYLKLFFPDSSKPVQSRFHGKLLQYSNLFLHVMIEFWLRQNLIGFSDGTTGTTATSTTSPVDYRVQQKLVSPLATVSTQTAYMAPSDDLLSSLLVTIIHLLSDSFYPAPLEVASTSTTGTYSGMVVGSGGGYLSPSISVMRRPLYELFRLVFSRAPIGLSPTAFLAISDVWLAYIQPWNCQMWAKGQAPPTSTGGFRRAPSDTTSATEGTSGSATSTSAYTSAWETYVLANYHFYTTLLGAFIERAKELDFTGSDERSLVVLDRVLSVYNPELLALLRRASDFLDKNQPYSIASSSSSLLQISTKSSKNKNATDRSEELSPLQGQVLTYHCKALGIECIGVPIHATYHRDAERVFDKLWSDSGISGAADSPSQISPRGQSSSGESLFERVHRLSRQLRRVFEISDAYVASTVHSRTLSSANGLEPLEPSRHSKLRHLLTLEGINQLRRGLRLCSPEELSYIGDPMLRPICSYEFGVLVRLSYRVSTWLNTQFGLVSPYKGKYFEDNAYVDPDTSFNTFRFNLRFLASKPNLAFLTIVLWVLYLVLLW